MPDGPSTHGDNGRGHAGRFASGNRFGRGNPLAGRAAKIRAALLMAVTPEDVHAAALAVLAQAKAGDLRAFAELLDRTIGRPTQQDVLERLEALERVVAEGSVTR